MRSKNCSLCAKMRQNHVSQPADQGFFFEDKRFEISNLDLIRDMADLVALEKVLIDFSSPQALNFCI